MMLFVIWTFISLACVYAQPPLPDVPLPGGGMCPFLPAGTDFGDTAKDIPTDAATPPFAYTFPFYDTVVVQVWVNDDGVLSFDSVIPADPTPDPFPGNQRFFAGYWTDIHVLENPGQVYCRLSTSVEDLAIVDQMICDKFCIEWHATAVFIVTYYIVTTAGAGAGGAVSTFQMIIATDGVETFMGVIYGDLGFSSSNGIDFAQGGVSNGVDNFFPIDNSNNVNVDLNAGMCYWWRVGTIATLLSAQTIICSKVDDDPHFMFNMIGSEEPVCFFFDAKDGDVLQLVHDKDLDLTVNGEIFALPSKKNNYFKKIAMMSGDKQILANDQSIEVMVNGQVVSTLYWNEDNKYTSADGDLVITVNGKGFGRATIAVGNRIEMTVLHHRRLTNYPYLGFFISRQSGLSQRTHGLIGQFTNKEIMIEGNIEEKRSPGYLTFLDSGKKVTLKAGSQVNTATHTRDLCWMGEVQGRGLIDGEDTDYIINDVLYHGIAPGLSKYVETF